MIPAVFALLLAVSEWFGLLSSRTPRTPRVKSRWWIALIVGSYAVQLWLIRFAAHHQYPSAPWRLTMPIPVVDDRGLSMAGGNLVTTDMLALALAQSYALLAVYRARSCGRAVAIGCGVMLALSLAAPAMLSFDPYGYVHDALLGLAAYAPPNVPFTGEYHVFDLWFGKPSPTLYGPLWLVVVRVVTAAGWTLLGKLIAWRAFCVLLYLAFLVGLRALRLPARIVAVAAVNPGLMLQFVANGHNDLLAIVLLVYAAVLIRRVHPVLGIGAIAVAGLVKLPYAVLGLPLLGIAWSGVQSVSYRALARCAGAVAVLAVVLALSWIGGGHGYLESLMGHVGSKPGDLVHRLADAAALALIAVALFGGRRLRSGVWLMPMLGTYIFAWYFAWGLPYALARRRVLSYLFVCSPFVMMLIESAFVRPWSVFFVLPAVAFVALFAPDKPVTREARGRR